MLLPLTAVAPFFRVAVGRNYSLHTGPAFIVAGALVLHPLGVLALVAALHISQFVRGRYPWYIHLFNLANYVLSALAAWLVVEAVRATTTSALRPPASRRRSRSSPSTTHCSP